MRFIFWIGKLVNVLGQVDFVSRHYEDINKVYGTLVTRSSKLDRTIGEIKPGQPNGARGNWGRLGNSFSPSTQLTNHVVPQSGRQVTFVSPASARKSRGFPAREYTLGPASSLAGTHPARDEGPRVNFWESQQGVAQGGGQERGGPEVHSRKPSASPARAAPSSTHSVGGPNSVTRLLSLQAVTQPGFWLPAAPASCDANNGWNPRPFWRWA